LPYRSTEILPHGTGGNRTPVDIVVLTHDQRHVRRKLLHMQHDDVVMLDLKEPVQLAHGDLLLTETGDVVEVVAAEEELYEVTPKERILILRDHVIRDMLAGLGALVRDVSEPFQPVRGAYHGSGHGHGHHTHNHG
jgi:urease accessory protein